MGAPVLLIAGAALALVVLSRKKKGGSTEEAISDTEAALLERLPDGSLRYKPGEGDRNLVLLSLSLQGKSLIPTGDDQLYGLKQALSLQTVPPSTIGASVFNNAYEAAKDLHARGFDIWVTPTLLPKKAQTFAERYLYAGSPGHPIPSPDTPVQLSNPPATGRVGTLALFRAANQPWVSEVGTAPAPPLMAPPAPGV